MISQEEQNNASDLAATDAALLAAIHNTAVDAIITIDERGNILNANRALQKLFGYLPSELIGKNISCLMPEPDRSSHDGYLAKYQQTGKAAIIGIGRQVMGQRRDRPCRKRDPSGKSQVVHWYHSGHDGAASSRIRSASSPAAADSKREADRYWTNDDWLSARKPKCLATLESLPGHARIGFAIFTRSA